ncbi:hypothetical protein P5673_003946 [Acropora cervicornis]|uniref:Uncharacterized protein n=1 Tax=Acropora cervicornis TaxID=6130 RepID=A0AAD9R1G2_ACRCE|nr:hypothetical protein P5673_003946 [Acropora cervicornis]
MWNEFDATVEEIAELTSMPMKLKKVIKRSRNFNRGDVLALNRLQFKIQGGNMVQKFTGTFSPENDVFPFLIRLTFHEKGVLLSQV